MNDERREDYERFLKLNLKCIKSKNDEFWIECYKTMDDYFHDKDYPDISVKMLSAEFRWFCDYWNVRIDKRNMIRQTERMRIRQKRELIKAINGSSCIPERSKERLAAKIA